MTTNNPVFQVPRRRPPHPPSQPGRLRKQPPLPPPKPAHLQEQIFELPGDTIEIQPQLFEFEAEPVDEEIGSDDHLRVTHSDSDNWNAENSIHSSPFESIDHSRDALEQRFPSPVILTQIADELRIPLSCRHCRKIGQNIQELVFCRGCRRSFHQSCWGHYEDHVASPGIPSPCMRYTSLVLHIWTLHLHTPPDFELDVLQEMLGDRHHRWIGTPEMLPGNGDLQQPRLLLYPTLARQFKDFMQVQAVSNKVSKKQYPRLVAFFGDTGMGKSTIIKNLIRHVTSSSTFHVPIVGSSTEAQNSTSAGVHLYTDPLTFSEERPILYVDCEGLRGDSNPVANQVESRIRKAKAAKLRKPVPTRSTRVNQPTFGISIQPDCEQEETLRRGLENKPLPISSMPLPWATGFAGPWRSVVSEKIYPRFLYVFSDVVCYVSGNSRSAEDDMAQLVDWAHDAHDFTTNQGVKPGLLYIINQDNHSDLQKWRDINYATHAILEKLRKSKRFATEQDLWKSRGRRVATADQLLRCYYSSVKVVFIPQFLPSNPSCEADDLWSQYELLREEIQGLSWSSSEHRREARVLFNLETLSRHTVGVLQQLATDYTSSVDFHQLAEPAQPYPNGFSGHVLNVLSRFQEMSPKDQRINDEDIGAEEGLMKRICKYVAICIAREIRRTTSDRNSELGQIEFYTQKWRLALEDFSRTHCRCERISHGQRCLNYRISHIKGHQFNLKGRESVMDGPFVSRFLKALDSLQDELASQLPRFLKDSSSEQDLTRDLWHQTITCGAARIFSNRTCLACLSRTPVHPLPCSHCLCDPCAVNLNSRNRYEEPSIVILRCPFGCKWQTSKWTIRRKPSEAGVRMLTLDGGGVRGVIQLEILDAIARRVGHDIPMQELFDVIVGSGMGGIIALGIFKKGWPISDSKDNFTKLIKASFSKRSALKLLSPLPGGSTSAQIMLNHLYKSESLEYMLQTIFGSEERLFGCAGDDRQPLNKIAILASGEGRKLPYNLTNYNREWSLSDNENSNLREERPRDDLKTWEVARCTSVAPTYFEPYHHRATNRSYRDGMTGDYNQITMADIERQRLWPNPGESSSDILVSLGTGYASDFNGEAEKDHDLSSALSPLEKLGLAAKLATLRLVQQSTSNCHRTWLEYQQSISDEPRRLSRCHRFDIPYESGRGLCKVDEVSKVDDTRTGASLFLCRMTQNISADVQEQSSAKLNTIARQLLASLFYFQLHDAYDLNQHRYHCRGLLYCRLSSSCTSQMRSLIYSGRPRFRIYEEESFETDSEITFGSKGWDFNGFCISTGFDASIYAKGGVRIQVTCDGWAEAWEDISGFPRKFPRRRAT